jgi:hypothetical protein
MRALLCAVILLLANLLLGARAIAQEHRHGQAHSPYSGLKDRATKALSEQQLADLRAGRGMGLALAAELNGYPGPLHVLELAEQLKLSPEQLQRVAEQHASMKAEAVSVGEQLIAQEGALDRHFKDRTITPESLATLTALIGETQGKLRAVHLKYHLAMAELLTAEQSRHYAELRGYR